MDITTFKRRVGVNVRRARWSAGKTQQQLAAEALSFRLVSALEGGRGNLTLQTLFNLARALGVTVADLVDVQPARGPRLRDRQVTEPKAGRKAKPRRLPKRGS